MHFHIVNQVLIMSLTTLKTKRFIIERKTFLEEYHKFLEKFEVDFDERYIFKTVEYDEN